MLVSGSKRPESGGKNNQSSAIGDNKPTTTKATACWMVGFRKKPGVSLHFI